MFLGKLSGGDPCVFCPGSTLPGAVEGRKKTRCTEVTEARPPLVTEQNTWGTCKTDSWALPRVPAAESGATWPGICFKNLLS